MIELRGNRFTPGQCFQAALPLICGVLLAVLLEVGGQRLTRFYRGLPGDPRILMWPLFGMCLLIVIASFAYAWSRRLSLADGRLEYRSCVSESVCLVTELARAELDTSYTRGGAVKILSFWRKDGRRFLAINTNGWDVAELRRLIDGIKACAPELQVGEELRRFIS